MDLVEDGGQEDRGEEIFKADKWSVDSFARYLEDRIG